MLEDYDAPETMSFSESIVLSHEERILARDAPRLRRRPASYGQKVRILPGHVHAGMEGCIAKSEYHPSEGRVWLTILTPHTGSNAQFQIPRDCVQLLISKKKPKGKEQEDQ